ncbi:hypothetical protein KY335_02895 [Candidatus Woesearchaeota archaeon]|nr:hypothetical protein [Candidatus Woesearchaeota archaeon]
METYEEPIREISPIGVYLSKVESIENAVGNWIGGETGYNWNSMKELAEKHYEAIPEDQRLRYRSRHTKLLRLIADCQTIEMNRSASKGIQ